MKPHSSAMLCLLGEHSFNADLRQCYVYGSSLRPVLNVWARSIHPNAVSFGADKSISGNHSYVTVPERLSPDVVRRYDLALISIPVAAYEQLLDRRAFISVMRHPAMRVLRLALRHLRDDAGRDWREEIQEAEIIPAGMYPDSPWWVFSTNRYTVATIRPEDPHLTHEDFLAVFEDDGGCLDADRQADDDEWHDLSEDESDELERAATLGVLAHLGVINLEDTLPEIVAERERALNLAEEMARELAEEPGPPYVLHPCENAGQHGDDCCSVYSIEDPDDCVQAHVTYAAAYRFIYHTDPPAFDPWTEEEEA